MAMYEAAPAVYRPTGRTRRQQVELYRTRERHGAGSGRFTDDIGHFKEELQAEYVPEITGAYVPVNSYDVAVGRYADGDPIWSATPPAGREVYRPMSRHDAGLVVLSRKLGCAPSEVEGAFSPSEILEAAAPWF